MTPKATTENLVMMYRNLDDTSLEKIFNTAPKDLQKALISDRAYQHLPAKLFHAALHTGAPDILNLLCNRTDLSEWAVEQLWEHHNTSPWARRSLMKNSNIKNHVALEAAHSNDPQLRYLLITNLHAPREAVKTAITSINDNFDLSGALEEELSKQHWLQWCSESGSKNLHAMVLRNIKGLPAIIQKKIALNLLKRDTEIATLRKARGWKKPFMDAFNSAAGTQKDWGERAARKILKETLQKLTPPVKPLEQLTTLPHAEDGETIPLGDLDWGTLTRMLAEHALSPGAVAMLARLETAPEEFTAQAITQHPQLIHSHEPDKIRHAEHIAATTRPQYAHKLLETIALTPQAHTNPLQLLGGFPYAFLMEKLPTIVSGTSGEPISNKLTPQLHAHLSAYLTEPQQWEGLEKTRSENSRDPLEETVRKLTTN